MEGVKVRTYRTEIRTYSGLLIDVFNLREDDINISDICFGLCNVPRFGAQTDFYSVARHSIEVCDMLPGELKLAGLLHDASEAYIGDMPTPIKNRLHCYLELEKKIMGVVCKKYGINTYHEKVKEADHFSFLQEANLLWNRQVEREDGNKIKERFLELFFRYANG